MEALWTIVGAVLVGIAIGGCLGYPIGYVEGQSVLRTAQQRDADPQGYLADSVDMEHG